MTGPEHAGALPAAARPLPGSVHPLALLAAAALVAAGCALGVPAPGMVAVVVALAALAVAAAERRRPHAAAWLRDHGDRDADRAHLVATLVVAEGGARALGLLAATWAAPPAALALPLPLQVGLGLAVLDLAAYAGHRLLHAQRWLWRCHAVHHAARRLYWLGAARNHPVDVLLGTLLAALPLRLLGLHATAVALLSALTSVHLLLQHANLALAPSGWDRWLATAPAHRMHHARPGATAGHPAGCNLGRVLLLWDRLFGTYVPARPLAPAEVGLGAPGDLPHVPDDWWGQLRAPLPAPRPAPGIHS